jgi:hypothetical protein
MSAYVHTVCTVSRNARKYGLFIPRISVDLRADFKVWRALSTKHYRGQFPADFDDLMLSMDVKAVDILATIILIAGGEQKEAVEEVHKLARNDLDRLWELACNFSKRSKNMSAQPITNCSM